MYAVLKLIDLAALQAHVVLKLTGLVIPRELVALRGLGSRLALVLSLGCAALHKEEEKEDIYYYTVNTQRK